MATTSHRWGRFGPGETGYLSAMAEVVREGPVLRVILVSGGTPDPALVVSKVKEVLIEDEVAEVVIEIPGSDLRADHPVVADVIRELESETRTRGVPLRYSL